MLMTGNEHRLKYSRYGARSSHCSRHLSALKEQPLTTLQIGRHDTQSHGQFLYLSPANLRTDKPGQSLTFENTRLEKWQAPVRKRGLIHGLCNG